MIPDLRPYELPDAVEDTVRAGVLDWLFEEMATFSEEELEAVWYFGQVLFEGSIEFHKRFTGLVIIAIYHGFLKSLEDGDE